MALIPVSSILGLHNTNIVNSIFILWHSLNGLIIPGVTRIVGDALLLERSQRQGRVVSIGIAPWGILEKSHELVGRGGEVPYDSLASPW